MNQALNIKRYMYLLVFGLFGYLFIRLFLPVHADQTISVTGIVPPQASDFQTAIDTDTNHVIPENSVVTYTLTYGSHLDYADQMTIEASWGQGTVSGNSSPSVDGLDYVTGSAANAYNNTTPVVDLVNHKIDWTISSFPAQTTDQTVTFQLRTNTAYAGSQSVTFPIQVKLIAPHFTTSPASVTTTYLFDPGLANPPTPTAAPGPTATPKPQPTLTPTPTPPTIHTVIPSPSLFTDISILNLVSDAADISFIVRKPGTVQLSYGTSPYALIPQSPIKTTGFGTVSLTNLLPKTQYYFQLTFTGSSGSFTSEIFSLLTPPLTQVPQVSLPSLVFSTDADILYSAALTPQSGGSLTNPSTILPTIPLANTQGYTISFKITKVDNIHSVAIILKNTSVLGLTFPPSAKTPPAPIYTYTAYTKGDGIYQANITNALPPGMYSTYVRIIDTSQTMTTQQVANTHVLAPFRTFDSKTKKPIPDVRITLFRYDQTLKHYTILPTNSNITNPLYTDFTGQVSQQVPRGMYEARFIALGYSAKTVKFTIGISPTDGYPTVYLTPAPITLGSLMTYYRNALSDWLAITNAYLAALQQTYRFYNLFGLAIIFCFVSITWVLFVAKSRIGFTRMHQYFHHHLLQKTIKESPYVSGQIRDKLTQKSIAGAYITVVDRINRVVYQTTSSTKGSFLIPSTLALGNTLLIGKNGYEELRCIPEETSIAVSLTHHASIIHNDALYILHMSERLTSSLFACFLILSVLLEIVFLPTIGISLTTPFFLLSLLNLILWIFYTSEEDTSLLVK